MNADVPSDMIGLEQANAELDRMIAADQESAADPGPSAAAAPTDPSATLEADRAAQPGKESVPTPGKDSSAAPAAAPISDDTKNKQQDKTKTADPAERDRPSRYAKSVERQNRSWEELHTQKAALKAERERLDSERQAWEQQRAQTEAKQSDFTPEQYEQAADQWEKDGKFDLADLARTRAQQLRAHPPKGGTAAQPQTQPPTAAPQSEAQVEAARKEWWAKAAIDFPAVVKQGSPEQAAMAKFLEAEPAALQSPKALYYAARMVASETAAARVPALEKELGEARAKVKELEALTAPSPPGTPNSAPQGDVPFSQKSDAEQLAELERTALEIGPLR